MRDLCPGVLDTSGKGEQCTACRVCRRRSFTERDRLLHGSTLLLPDERYDRHTPRHRSAGDTGIFFGDVRSGKCGSPIVVITAGIDCFRRGILSSAQVENRSGARRFSGDILFLCRTDTVFPRRKHPARPSGPALEFRGKFQHPRPLSHHGGAYHSISGTAAGSERYFNRKCNTGLRYRDRRRIGQSRPPFSLRSQQRYGHLSPEITRQRYDLFHRYDQCNGIHHALHIFYVHQRADIEQIRRAGLRHLRIYPSCRRYCIAP